MSVGQAQARIGSAEFTDWLAYYQLEPFGEERADLRHAVLCALVANIFRGKGRRAKLTDFMPRFDEEPRPQSLADMRAVMERFTAAHNAACKARLAPPRRTG